MAAQWPMHNGLKVTVKRADGTPYPLVEHCGKLLVVAEPGDVFTVAVERSRDDDYRYEEHMLVCVVGYRGLMLYHMTVFALARCGLASHLTLRLFPGRTNCRQEAGWL
jgi:hypothetical protein